MKKLDLFEIILVVAVLGISLYAALSDAQNFANNWFIRDDAYYYFKVAQNISEGHGSTFDGINPSNGYHPLWMLICVPIFALARFDLILPLRVLLMVMSGLSVASAILFYRLLGKIFSPPIGAVIAVYWVFNYQIVSTIYQQGLETGIAAFFVLLLVYRLNQFERSWRTQPVSPKQLIDIGIIAALTLFSRLDLIFVVTFVGLWIIFRKHPLSYFLPLDMFALASAVLISFVNILGVPKGYYFYADSALAMLALALAIKIPLAYFMGLYQPTLATQSIFRTLKQIIIVSGIGSIIITSIMLILQKTNILIGFPRTALIYDLILTFTFMTIIRLGVRGLKTSTSPLTNSSTPTETLLTNWQGWLTEALSYYGVVFGALFIYMIVNKFAFGTFSPVSGQIKRWWATLPGTTYGGTADTLLAFFGLDYFGASNAWIPISSTIGLWAENISRKMTLFDYQRYLILLTIFAVLFYILLRLSSKKGKQSLVQLSVIPLLSGSYFQIYYYHAIGYSAFKNWYWVAQIILTALVLGMITGMLYDLILKIKYRHIIAWLAVAAFAINTGYNYFDIVRYLMPYNYWAPDAPNLDIVPFLESTTEPGSLIGMTGGGNVGYFIHDRTIINMDGLINSNAYFQALKEKQAGAYLASEGLNYIFARTIILDGQPYAKQFDPYLERTVYFYEGKDLLRFHPNP